MDEKKVYEQLAIRNGWDYSFSTDDNRPYFMKDGNYAVPDENTSLEDKQLLASIISEGSIEMAKLIITCWDNNIKIVGPCSGISEFHKERSPKALHFGFIADDELIIGLNEELNECLPNLTHLVRDDKIEGNKRYDVNYFLNGQKLSQSESDRIYSIINQILNELLQNKRRL